MAEKFSEKIVESAWKNANGHCERCGKLLVRTNRGRNSGQRGCWKAHHKNRSKESILSNCEILCVDCHMNTKSYGKSRKTLKNKF